MLVRFINLANETDVTWKGEFCLCMVLLGICQFFDSKYLAQNHYGMSLLQPVTGEL